MSNEQQPRQSVRLDYGRDGLEVRLPAAAMVLRPHLTPPLPDPASAVTGALRQPIGSAPLSTVASATVSAAKSGCRVAIVTSDLTRPVPNQLLLEAILADLHAGGIPAEAITLINGTGLHRPNSAAELSTMYGPATDIETTVAILAGEVARRLGRPPLIGVLPHGQQAVPVVREAALG